MFGDSLWLGITEMLYRNTDGIGDSVVKQSSKRTFHEHVVGKVIL